MTPETWSDVLSYVVLALGGAMAIGTGTALFRYHQTGLFPGQPQDDDGNPVGDPSVASAWIKVAVGGLLALWGLAGLVTDGLLDIL